jgi:hypothetical protein
MSLMHITFRSGLETTLLLGATPTSVSHRAMSENAANCGLMNDLRRHQAGHLSVLSLP